MSLTPGHRRSSGVVADLRDGTRIEIRPTAPRTGTTWRGRGVGTALLRELTERAREEGVRRFSAIVLSDNRQMLDMIAELGSLEVKDHQAGTVELEVELPATGPVPALMRTLRAAARGELRVRPRR